MTSAPSPHWAGLRRAALLQEGEPPEFEVEWKTVGLCVTGLAEAGLDFGDVRAAFSALVPEPRRARRACIFVTLLRGCGRGWRRCSWYRCPLQPWPATRLRAHAAPFRSVSCGVLDRDSLAAAASAPDASGIVAQLGQSMKEGKEARRCVFLSRAGRGQAHRGGLLFIIFD